MGNLKTPNGKTNHSLLKKSVPSEFKEELLQGVLDSDLSMP